MNTTKSEVLIKLQHETVTQLWVMHLCWGQNKNLVLGLFL